MVTAIVGGLIGWGIGAAAGLTMATAFTIWQAVMIGMSLGSLVGGLIQQNNANYDSSPTYSFGQISNTMSQNLPIPVIYGGEMRVAGNIIYQAYDSDEKKVQTLYVLLSEGEIENVRDVMANDQLVTDLPDCSLTIYKTTAANTHDSRDPSGTRPYPDNVAMLCMTLTASEKLNSQPTITSIVKGVKVWTPNGKVWSTNPIWCAIDLLANPRYGLGVCTYSNGAYDHPDWAQIDYTAAVTAANYCDGLVNGEKRFELTYVLDTQKPIKDVLSEMLSTCRGYMVETDKIQFHIDAPVNNYTREITTAHLVEGSFTWWQKTSEDMSNQFTVDWVDPNTSYDRVTDVFQDSNDIADRGIVTSSVQLVGITRQSQVERMGYYLLKTSLLVRNLCSFNVGIKDCDILPGEVIAITYAEFTGWNKKWFRVVSTKVVSETEMTVVCAEYIAACYDDSSIAVVSHIDTQRTKSYTPQEVTNLTVTEEVTFAEDGQYINTAIASWTPSSYANSVEVWYRFDNDAYYTMAATLSLNSTEFRLDATTHSVVYFKIITVSSIGIHSSGVVVRHTITGDVTPPAAPTNLTGIGGYKLANIKWTDPADNDLDHVDVYRSSDGNSYVVAGRSFRGEQAFIDSNLGILTNYWYKLKAVDSAGNESVFSAVTQAQTTAIPPVDIPDYSIDGHKMVTDIFGDNDNTARAVIEQVLNNYGDKKQQGVEIRQVSEVLDDVTGRWYVKIDNNKRVAGLALYNGNQESNFTVLADKLFIYGTGTGGSELKQVFAVDTTTGKVVLQGDLLADGSITGAKINASAQIILGNGGQLIMGAGSVLQMSSGAVVLDSEQGVLQIKDANNLQTGDYIRIETGDISTFTYIAGTYHQLKSLRQMAFGEAVSGENTIVGGVNNPVIFASTPNILVSPATTQCYHPDYPTQPQTIRCYANNIYRNPTTGIVTFTPMADLIIASHVTRDTTLRTSYTNNWANPLGTITASLTITLPQTASNVRITFETAGNFYSHSDKFYQNEIFATISATNGNTVKTCVTAERQKVWYTNLVSVATGTYRPNWYYFPSCAFSGNEEFPVCREYADFTNTYLLGTYKEFGWSNFSTSHTVDFNALESPTITISSVFTAGHIIHDYSPIEAWIHDWYDCKCGCIAIKEIQYQQQGTTQLATGTVNYMAIAE